MTPQEKAAALRKLVQRKREFAFAYFQPYKKQKLFFDLGAEKVERLLIAGNQQGKTHAGAFEVTCHMTGLYPPWWKGRRWDRPTRGWICGETAGAIRDTQQKKLCGEAGVEAEFGTGLLPKHLFVEKPSLARGVTDFYDTIQVRHCSGGISVARQKSYEQGREKFQGETLDWIWNDEETPMDVYIEELARISSSRGMIFTTFTSLKGMRDVVERFLKESDAGRETVTMTIDDVIGEPHGHITEDMRAGILARYPAYQHDARIFGGVLRGEGRVFQATEDQIKEPVLTDLPGHWTKLWGIDFGIAHPFAAVLIAWDKDNDCIHVLHALRMKTPVGTMTPPIIHAAAMKPIGAAVPVAWPQDGTQRDKGSGEQLSHMYRAAGLRMLGQHATFPDGSVSTEAGIAEMDERMITGRFKVAAHLNEWFEEFRNYYREKGLIVKERDDLMSATRIAIMAKRYGQAVPLGGRSVRRQREQVCDGLDFSWDW